MMRRRTFLVALAGLVVTRKWKPASAPALSSGDPGLASYGIGGGFISPEAPVPQLIMKTSLNDIDIAPLGSIMPYAGIELPKGFVPCDGRRLDNPALAKLGFGARVPDLRGYHPVSNR